MRTILLTGATGAIGSALAKNLLQEQDTQVRLLVRARSESHLVERLKELYRFWAFEPHDEGISARLQAFVGDVTLPGLGLEKAVYQRLAAEVSHVVHSAGNVKLNRPLDEARRSAVDSAGHILSFVHECGRAGSFQKLEFVSTVGVAGRMPGLVPERAMTERRSFHNTYESAKAEAETIVLREIEQGLPATVHRPSMVVGDSRDGRIIQFQVFYYLCEFLSGRRTAGIIPDAPGIRLDIIPVDYIARAIQVSSRRTDAAGRIFHLCAGPEEAPPVNDLARRVRRIFASRGRKVPPLRPISPRLMRVLVGTIGRVVPGQLRRSLQSLPHFLAYLDAPQTFDNVVSRAYFSGVGVQAPSVDSYLDTVLSYYLSRESGTRESLVERAAHGVA